MQSDPDLPPVEDQSSFQRLSNFKTAVKQHFCCREGIVGTATQDFEDESRNLLRSRLLAISVIALVGHALFFVRSLVIGYPFLWLQSFPLLVLGTTILILRSDLKLSQRYLRTLDLTVFGTAALHTAWIYYLVTTRFAEQGDVIRTSLTIQQLTASFSILIVCYGMFIPNSWIRALGMVSWMLAVSILMSAYLSWWHPLVSELTTDARSAEQFSYSALLLLVSGLIAIFGAHTIHAIRRTATTVKEMGRYQLRQKIGAGGMGDVWLAEHTMLARPAAIKMIRSEVLTRGNSKDAETVSRRFEREARTTAGLRSPHTVQLYDFGTTHDGVFYYVMEFLEGLDLETLVRRYGPLPAERVIYLLQQATESLAEAHQKGLVHRDLKPSNLFISQMGIRSDFLKVLDFGLVKRLDSKFGRDTRLTQDGSTTGTPAYMSPEMALGNDEVDERSDIYSLGCVAYWMLTGFQVFEGQNPVQVAVAHAQTPPIPPSQRTELKIPADLEQIVLDCLEKTASERPQDMMELSRRVSSCRDSNLWTNERSLDWWNTHHPQTSLISPTTHR